MSRCVTLVFQHFALCSYSCQQRNHRLYCIVLCTHYYWSMIKLIKLMQINICIMMKDDVKYIYVIFRWRFHEFIALNFCNMLRLHSMSSSCKHCLVNHWWLLSEIKQLFCICIIRNIIMIILSFRDSAWGIGRKICQTPVVILLLDWLMTTNFIWGPELFNQNV